jgi:hypothetical protein
MKAELGHHKKLHISHLTSQNRKCNENTFDN